MGRRITDLEHAKRDDDLLSYLFIDLALYKDEDGMSRKMQREHFKAPNENWEPLLQIIEDVKSGKRDAREAANLLVKKNPIRALLERKREGPLRQHLLAHVARYMELWKPDCDFRIFTTHRYKLRIKERLALAAATYPSPSPTPQPSASQSSSSSLTTMNSEDPPSTFVPPLDLGVKANRNFEVNEYIRLYGSAADLTDEQDDEMRMETSQLKADFSVLFNNTKNCFQIFMGPGRFVNHDCNNNVELIRSGRNLCFKVVRPIQKDEEIYTFYGEEYFGKNNETCRCWTCRQACKGIWADLAEEEGKVAPPPPPKEARFTRSGLLYEAVKSEEPERRRSVTRGERKSDRTTTRKATRDSIKKAVTPKKASAKTVSKGKGKRRRQESSDMESDEEAVDVDWRPATKAKKQRKVRTLTSLDSDSDLTDLEDLGIDLEEESRAVQIDTSTGTAINPLTGDTTALEPTEANVNMLSASIPVVDEAMPSPMMVETPPISAPQSPAPQGQPPQPPTSLSRSLLDKFGTMGRTSSTYPGAVSPKTESSDVASSSQLDSTAMQAKED